jgi:glycosyltransferase involved in cell wall biosynthesis
VQWYAGVDLRVLLVSYSFPPVGGAGVQRVVKLAKYLPHHGVWPAILTAKNPSVPLHDASLLRDLPRGIEVERARTLEPGYGLKRIAWRAQAARSRRAHTHSVGTRGLGALTRVAKQALFPDAQVLWQPAALGVLAHRLAARRDDAVLVSGPPFSQFLLAPLARAGRVGVVLDYRDEWSTLRSTYEMTRSRLARVFGDPLEAALLRQAHAIVTATDEFRDHLLARFQFVDPGRVFAIPNGYDPDDFPDPLPSPPGDRLVITYAGTIFSLTSARGLLGAVRLLHQRSPEIARSLRLRFVGRVVDTELDAFDGTETLGVERAGYVPHDDVLHELAASHRTLCLLDDVPGAERIYPAKIFELMRLGRPIMTLAPPGSALTRLVERHGLGPTVHPRDDQAICAALELALRAFRKRGSAPATWRKTPGIERYDRRSLAGEFADILKEAAGAARRRGM